MMKLVSVPLRNAINSLDIGSKKQVFQTFYSINFWKFWFIEKYGTHIVVGVKMGGKDVTRIKQLQNSNAQPREIQKLLKNLADERFSEEKTPTELSGISKDEDNLRSKIYPGLATSIRRPIITKIIDEDILSVSIRRGGVDIGQSHNEWLSTISQSPNVISMSFVPITSLLSGVRGNGFLSHAVNLYLRYKPPIKELQQFLEFQVPRQWAPIYGDLPLTLKRRNKLPRLLGLPLWALSFTSTL